MQRERISTTDRIVRPFARFAELEASSGIALILVTVVALVWSNSPWSESYHNFFHQKLAIKFDNSEFSMSLAHWINDALMAFFFLLVGMEIKRSMLIGELKSPKKAMLPLLGAIGGMVVPALIFAMLNQGNPNIKGWAIPMATDIAFALGMFALFARWLPAPLRIFLAALAIIDDIGAVLVIALFYSSGLAVNWLVAAGVCVAAMTVLARLGLRSLVVYMLGFAVLWFCIYNSGTHSTIAGVLTAFIIPAQSKIDSERFMRRANRYLDKYREAEDNDHPGLLTEAQGSAVHSLEKNIENLQSPLQRLEHMMHPWVSWVIMPVFALANAGVTVGSGALSSLFTSQLSLGVILGLSLGKPIGILLMCWIGVKFKWCSLPSSVRWRQLFAVGCLAGIGFTMSLFIAGLAFGTGETLDLAKLAILVASALSAGLAALIAIAGTRKLGTEKKPVDAS